MTDVDRKVTLKRTITLTLPTVTLFTVHYTVVVEP
jgi:hypothetical protein